MPFIKASLKLVVTPLSSKAACLLVGWALGVIMADFLTALAIFVGGFAYLRPPLVTTGLKWLSMALGLLLVLVFPVFDKVVVSGISGDPEAM